MDARTLALKNEWMTEDERKTAIELAKDFEDMFNERGIAPTPFANLRAAEIILLETHARRIEARLKDFPAIVSENTKRGATLEELIECAGKARERVRKAVKELEEYCANAGTPIDKGLAGTMRPILKKAEGIFDDPRNLRTPKTPKKNAKTSAAATNHRKTAAQ